jgi:threonine synthase
MGKLVIGTNVNDILVRALRSGRYEPHAVEPSSSPAMDIQVSSNFERVLFDAHDRDGTQVVRMMQSLHDSGAFAVAPAALARIRADFDAAATDEAGTLAEIAGTFADTGRLVDPHTAVGLAAARALDVHGPVVSLSTAHPAKFPDAVERATGERPQLPARLADLLEREERYAVLPADPDAVRAFIADRAKEAA